VTGLNPRNTLKLALTAFWAGAALSLIAGTTRGRGGAYFVVVFWAWGFIERARGGDFANQHMWFTKALAAAIHGLIFSAFVTLVWVAAPAVRKPGSALGRVMFLAATGLYAMLLFFLFPLKWIT
jgi:hypothetical protein